jgi:hypothetical protein
LFQLRQKLLGRRFGVQPENNQVRFDGQHLGHKTAEPA